MPTENEIVTKEAQNLLLMEKIESKKTHTIKKVQVKNQFITMKKNNFV